jgi:hypothetical protein
MLVSAAFPKRTPGEGSAECAERAAATAPRLGTKPMKRVEIE